jgi:hypothetical protein
MPVTGDDSTSNVQEIHGRPVAIPPSTPSELGGTPQSRPRSRFSPRWGHVKEEDVEMERSSVPQELPANEPVPWPEVSPAGNAPEDSTAGLGVTMPPEPQTPLSLTSTISEHGGDHLGHPAAES